MRTWIRSLILGRGAPIAVQEQVHMLNDVSFGTDDYETISSFIGSSTGAKFFEHLRIQQAVIADRAAGETDAVRWQGFVLGYKSAIDNILMTFREPPVNGNTSGESGGVGLEELAEALRPKE